MDVVLIQQTRHRHDLLQRSLAQGNLRSLETVLAPVQDAGFHVPPQRRRKELAHVPKAARGSKRGEDIPFPIGEGNVERGGETIESGRISSRGGIAVVDVPPELRAGGKRLVNPDDECVQSGRLHLR